MAPDRFLNERKMPKIRGKHHYIVGAGRITDDEWVYCSPGYGKY
jgi:hypothetical protein